MGGPGNTSRDPPWKEGHHAGGANAEGGSEGPASQGIGRMGAEDSVQEAPQGWGRFGGCGAFGGWVSEVKHEEYKPQGFTDPSYYLFSICLVIVLFLFFYLLLG